MQRPLPQPRRGQRFSPLALSPLLRTQPGFPGPAPFRPFSARTESSARTVASTHHSPSRIPLSQDKTEKEKYTTLPTEPKNRTSLSAVRPHGLWWTWAPCCQGNGQRARCRAEGPRAQGVLGGPLTAHGPAWVSRAPRMGQFERILTYITRIRLFPLNQRTDFAHQDSGPRVLEPCPVQPNWP